MANERKRKRSSKRSGWNKQTNLHSHVDKTRLWSQQQKSEIITSWRKSLSLSPQSPYTPWTSSLSTARRTVARFVVYRDQAWHRCCTFNTSNTHCHSITNSSDATTGGGYFLNCNNYFLNFMHLNKYIHFYSLTYIVFKTEWREKGGSQNSTVAQHGVWVLFFKLYWQRDVWVIKSEKIFMLMIYKEYYFICISKT